MPNRLAHESSPYLLQHQHNPVDWYPWGPEALARSRSEEKPIFLSIGYSACHWCHVMEHESFESEAIAAELNRQFICIKVDREERPDLDQIYMNAVQLMTGRGGWPMSVFLTPDLRPFYGGTYWPPTSRMGLPGFDRVIAAVADAWQNRRAMALDQAAEMTQHLQTMGQYGEAGKSEPGTNQLDTLAAVSQKLTVQLLTQSGSKLQRAFDATHGGFGTAPKFPHSMDLQVLLRLYQRQPNEQLLEMVTLTLDKMAQGGIYDHLAGGFARYSVDERWLVPHFEKMLYDNALLTSAYVEAFQVTGFPRYARTVRETCDYLLAYMTDPLGGFHSTEDADSEGVEGKFYVWTPAEIEQILGDKAAAETFCAVYDVTAAGNFEHGHSILNLPKTVEQFAASRGLNVSQLEAQLAGWRKKLLTQRDQRIRPSKDDKILVSWNALMIQALAQAGTVLNEPRYLVAAEKSATFILEKMARPDGHLLHTYRLGQAKLDAYLDDYTYFINALISLYEATFDERWMDEAVRIAEIVLAQFEDKEAGGFYFTADDHEQLIARNKDVYDSSVPSGNAMAATALLRLGKLCGRADFLTAAEGALLIGHSLMERSPTAAGQMLIALDLYLGPMFELVLVGDLALAGEIRQRFFTRRVLAARSDSAESRPHRSPHLQPLFEGRESAAAEPTLYICQNFTCGQPVVGAAAIRQAVRTLGST